MADKQGKPDGWFSRRHETREAHDRAKAHHVIKVERKALAEQRLAKRLVRGDDQQLEDLDMRLGENVGARRERARLAVL